MTIRLAALSLAPATGVPFLLMQLGVALGAGALVYVALTLILRMVGKKLSASGVNARPEEGRPWAVLRPLGRVITQTSRLFVLVAAVTAGCFVVPLPDPFRSAVHSLFVTAFVVQGAIWAGAALSLWLDALGNGTGEDRRALANATAIIGTLARATLWTVAVLLILDNLGFNITTLIAGLGIGGIAVGLAAQKILGDLFASLAILLDKPFEYGDFIVAGNHMGTVERIGLKTTRLRSLSGEQLVIANADLLDSRIQNYKRMAERRVVFTLGVVYGTPIDRMTAIPLIIREAITRQFLTRFDRSHFTAYGESALSFESVYYILSADYTAYMDVHQAIMLEIYQRFAEEGIAFAFPTRTILMDRLGTDGALAPRA